MLEACPAIARIYAGIPLLAIPSDSLIYSLDSARCCQNDDEEAPPNKVENLVSGPISELTDEMLNNRCHACTPTSSHSATSFGVLVVCPTSGFLRLFRPSSYFSFMTSTYAGKSKWP